MRSSEGDVSWSAGVRHTERKIKRGRRRRKKEKGKKKEEKKEIHSEGAPGSDG
jgi:hypothetical protein